MHSQRKGYFGMIWCEYTADSKPIVGRMAQKANAANSFKAYKKHHDDGEYSFLGLTDDLDSSKIILIQFLLCINTKLFVG